MANPKDGLFPTGDQTTQITRNDAYAVLNLEHWTGEGHTQTTQMRIFCWTGVSTQGGTSFSQDHTPSQAARLTQGLVALSSGNDPWQQTECEIR